MKTILFSMLSLVLLTGCIDKMREGLLEKSEMNQQSREISKFIAPPLAAVNIQEIFPREFIAIDAKLGSGQSIDSLATLDQAGNSQDWLNYVELDAENNFAGIFKFDLGQNINEVKSLKLKFNYFGTSAQYQDWKFSLKDITTGAWIAVANNSQATPWIWSKIEVVIENPEKFVNLSGTIDLKYTSEMTAGAHKEKSYLDFLSLEIQSL